MKNTFKILAVLLLITSCIKDKEEKPTEEVRDLILNIAENVTGTDTTYTITFTEDLPNNFSEVEKMVNLYNNNPQKMVALTIASFHLFHNNRANAIDAVALVSHSAIKSDENLTSGQETTVKDQLTSYPKTAYIYLKGANLANEYTATKPYSLELSTNSYSGSIASGTIKYFIASEATDTPRPITLKLENGKWRASNYSSLLTGYVK